MGYVSPDVFGAKFGNPGYGELVAWAQDHNLGVVTYPGQLLVFITGTAQALEQALYVNFNYYLRPDGTQFYAPDRDPSVDLCPGVLAISGMDNFSLPRGAGGGTGPNNSLSPTDIRTAYASCTSRTGSGQILGMIEFNGFRQPDIQAYEQTYTTLLGSAAPDGGVNVPINIVGVDGGPTTAPLCYFANDAGAPVTPDAGTCTCAAGCPLPGEATGDIETAIAMAPGLSQIRVYQGQFPFGDVLLAEISKLMPLPSAVSNSWAWISGPAAASQQSAHQQYLQLASEGVSFFSATGDFGAFSADPAASNSDSFITLVGGTDLNLGGTPLVYQGESPWCDPVASCLTFPACCTSSWVATTMQIPWYQANMPATLFNAMASGGSTLFRNVPDVAAAARNFQGNFFGPGNGGGGTSLATPIWASFIALADEQNAANHRGPLGFANPALYEIAGSSLYTSTFNDIVVDGGTNTGPVPNGAPNVAATGFPAVPGYNLVDGLGTPRCALLNALAPAAPPALVVSASATGEGPDICITGQNFVAGGEVHVFLGPRPVSQFGQLTQGQEEIQTVSVGPDGSFVAGESGKETGAVCTTNAEEQGQATITATEVDSSNRVIASVQATLPNAFWCSATGPVPGFSGTTETFGPGACP
jgi:kumamolisin